MFWALCLDASLFFFFLNYFQGIYCRSVLYKKPVLINSNLQTQQLGTETLGPSTGLDGESETLSPQSLFGRLAPPGLQPFRSRTGLAPGTPSVSVLTLQLRTALPDTGLAQRNQTQD